MTLRKAAEQALAAIKSANQVNYSWACVEAVAVLEAALAEEAMQRLTDVSQEIEAALAEQEPVAWMEMVVANLVREGVNKHKARQLAHHFAALVAAAERKVIMDSLQKQADMATDALDRRWALEMITAVAARSSK